MIQTVDNYYLLPIEVKRIKKEKEKFLEKKSYYCLSYKYDPKELNFTFKDYLEKSKNNTFFSFFKNEDKQGFKNRADDIIITISKNNNDENIAQTGNYVGMFYINKLKVEIESRFSKHFLTRMLNFANDVYLDDVDIAGDKSNKELDISKFIIYYLFVQSFEKAFLLGMPKSYQSIKYHDVKLKGNIDINEFIKNDIPFKGKVSSVSREQKEIQEIIDVLHKAVSVLENNGFSTKNITRIKTHLKQQRSSAYVSNQIIKKAMNAKALQNPIFAPYKKILKYAKYIIDGSNLKQKVEGQDQTFGFLINVAELFEIYVTKLLKKEFPDWNIDSPMLRLDDKEEGFGDSYMYRRNIIPDIVMIHKDTNNVMVFDTKYKRMTFHEIKGNGSDIDRCDFFQINTYMNFYNNQKKYNLIAGGLLYPIEGNLSENITYSDSWFGNNKVEFLIDGIDLSEVKLKKFKEENNDIDDTSLERKNLLDSEQKFIGRINKLIGRQSNE